MKPKTLEFSECCHRTDNASSTTYSIRTFTSACKNTERRMQEWQLSKMDHRLGEMQFVYSLSAINLRSG